MSTGELLRKEISDNTELGKQISTIMDSSLVSDNIVGDLTKNIYQIGYIKIDWFLMVIQEI